MFDPSFALAMSCAVPAAVGLYKYKQMDARFHLFVFALLLAVTTELAVEVVFRTGKSFLYYPIGNFYYLVNVLLYHYFFSRFSQHQNKRNQLAVSVFFVFCWLCNCVYASPLKTLFLYTAVVYAIFILVSSVNLLSRQVFNTRIPVFKNPLFYISSGCILFNSYFLFTQTVYFTIQQEGSLANSVYFIEKYINAFTYLVFTIGVLWIPKKSNSSALY